MREDTGTLGNVKEMGGISRKCGREIGTLAHQQTDKGELHQIFTEFEQLYTEAPPDVKRRLLNVIVEEIRCMVKRGEKTGEIEFRLRGDGSVRQAWERAKKRTWGAG